MTFRQMVVEGDARILAMSYMERMLESIRSAPYWRAIQHEIGDPLEFVGKLLLYAGAMALLSSTGVGAVIAACVAVVMAAAMVAQIIEGVLLLVEFFFRIESASTEDDLDEAGEVFAAGVAKIGINILLLLIGNFAKKGMKAVSERYAKAVPSAKTELNLTRNGELYSRLPEVLRSQKVAEALDGYYRRAGMESVRTKFVQDRIARGEKPFPEKPIMEKISGVTEDQHMVPKEFIKMAKGDPLLTKAQLNAMVGVRGTPNKYDILYEFHQLWVHGDGVTLGNKGNGGQWNAWWNVKRARRAWSKISPEEWIQWRKESLVFLDELWIKYLQYLGVKE